MLKRKQLFLLNPAFWDDRYDRYFMTLYKKKKNIESLYALCASGTTETYHHWRVFTGLADGACILLNRNALEAKLNSMQEIRYRYVRYMKLNELDGFKDATVDDIPFLKRYGFEHEAEYRVIVESDSDQKPAYPLDIDLDFIQEISLNPWLPTSIADSLKELIKTIDGCAKVKITHSHLIDNAKWKKFGDKLISRT